jgi:hypothetical protein
MFSLSKLLSTIDYRRKSTYNSNDTKNYLQCVGKHRKEPASTDSETRNQTKTCLLLISVPSSGSRKNGNSSASSAAMILLKPEEVKWEYTRDDDVDVRDSVPCNSLFCNRATRGKLYTCSLATENGVTTKEKRTWECYE